MSQVAQCRWRQLQPCWSACCSVTRAISAPLSYWAASIARVPTFTASTHMDLWTNCPMLPWVCNTKLYIVWRCIKELHVCWQVLSSSQLLCTFCHFWVKLNGLVLGKIKTLYTINLNLLRHKPYLTQQPTAHTIFLAHCRASVHAMCESVCICVCMCELLWWQNFLALNSFNVYKKVVLNAFSVKADKPNTWPWHMPVLIQIKAGRRVWKLINLKLPYNGIFTKQ